MAYNSVMTKKTKRLMVFLVIVVAIIGIGWAILENSATRRLSKIGYSKDEITLITEKLRNAELEQILQAGYLPKLVEILAEREAPADFRMGKLSDYIQVQQKYDFLPEVTVKLANHPDYDMNEIYTAQKVDILYDEYYLSENRGRYFAILDENPERLAGEIVALVNANRDREYYTETEPANIESDHLMLVNKYYYLDHDFAVEVVEQDASYGSVGERMEVETYAAFQEMFQAALEDGYQLYVTSGYRGYEEQEEVFASYLLEGDENYALQYAAKPGYSEHQTGRAIDVFTPGETIHTFAYSPVATWLAEHAYEYGFILRYPEGKENLTGYSYEPWHYRYVGKEVAAEIQRRGITLEEYVAVFGN